MKTNEELLATLGQAVEAELQQFVRALVTTPDVPLQTLERQVHEARLWAGTALA
jgi:hypothetical protein